MEKTGNSEKQHSLWLAAAMLAPAVHCAPWTNWAAVLAIGAAAVILGRWSVMGGGWIRTVQRIWCSAAAAVLMDWSTAYWPGMPFRPVVPLILLALAVWTLQVPGKAGKISCVLIWPMFVLLGTVILSGVPEMNLDHLQPEWEMTPLCLAAILLFPAAGRGNIKSRTGLALTALITSVIVSDVVSQSVSAKVPSGIYEMSRSLSMLGIAERFESIVAAIMTLGFYTAIAYLLGAGEETKNKAWMYGILTGTLYLAGITVNGWILAAGSVIAWVILPLAGTGKIISKKEKKGIDKT